MSARDWRIDVAFNLNDLVVLVIDDLPAPHAAVRANGAGLLAIVNFGFQVMGFL